mgnify:CR=1 FL=1
MIQNQHNLSLKVKVNLYLEKNGSSLQPGAEPRTEPYDFLTAFPEKKIGSPLLSPLFFPFRENGNVSYLP